MSISKPAPGDPRDPSRIVKFDKNLVKFEIGDLNESVAYSNLISLVCGLYAIVFKVRVV